jgi:hypothetical protein
MVACDWTLDTSCCEEWATYEPAVQTAATEWAMGILDALTGRRFGQCPVTVRPCGRRCRNWGGYMTYPVDSPSATGAWGAWMVPYVDGTGTWRNCGCVGECSCRASQEVPLPTPAAGVDEVMVDGVVLAPATYRLDNGRILVRIDGDAWPQCQDMDLANGEVGAFAVTYRPGEELPAAGRIAAGKLACEFAKACTGAGDCQLPGQLQSLSRNGVQVEMVDPSEVLGDGVTGVPEVDLWIRSVNPKRLASRSRVYSPDIRTPRFTS